MATSKIAKAATTTKDLIKGTNRVLNWLLQKPAKQAGGLISDSLNFWRWKNRLKIAHRAEEIIQKDELAKTILPPSFLMPLIEMAGDVEDPELQELWARLIASGTNDKKHQHPAFAKVLSQLCRTEATLLERLSECVFEFSEEYDFDALSKSYLKRPLTESSTLLAKLECDEEELWTYLSHLHVLGLVIPESTEYIRYSDKLELSPAGKQVLITASLTKFGVAFLNACKPSAKFGKLWKQQEAWRLLADSSTNSKSALKAAMLAEASAETAQDEIQDVRFDLDSLEEKIPKPPKPKKKRED